MSKLLFTLLAFSILSFGPKEKKKVLFFGDSITQAGVSEKGYITQMAKMIEVEGLENNVELIGKGIGGNKVYDLYLRMQTDCIAHNPDIVVIYIGVNDVWHKQSHGTGTDADKFTNFYQAIIDSLQSKGIELILCTPGVIGERTDFSNTLDGDLNHYTNIIKGLASKNNIALCDLREEMLSYNKSHNKENLEKGILTNDRVHLNEDGNKLVASSLWKIIRDKV